MALRDWLDEATAEVNPFDGGKNAASVRASRPAKTAQLPTRSQRQFVPMRDPNKAFIDVPAKPKPVPKVDTSFTTKLKQAGTMQGLGALRSATGLAQGVSGLYDLASPGTGTNRFSKKLDTFAKSTDDTAAAEAEANTSTEAGKKAALNAYKGYQGATDVLSFAAGDAAFKGVGTVANKGSAAVRQTTKLVRPVTAAFERGVDALDNGNRAQRVAGVAARTFKPSSLINTAANTGVDLGAEASKGRDISAGDVAVSAGMNIGINTGLPVASKLISEHANAVKPLVRPAVDAVADVAQKGARATGDYLSDMGTAAFNIKPHRGVPDEFVAAADRVRTAQSMNAGQEIDPNDLAMYRQLQEKIGSDVNDPGLVDKIIRDRRVWAEEGRSRIIEEENAIAKARTSSEGGFVRLPGGERDMAPDLNVDQKTFINDYAEMIEGMDATSKGGQMVPDGEGGYTRVSENSPFYRQVYAEQGRPPTKAEWFEEARRQIESGKGIYGASDDYKGIPPMTQPMTPAPITPDAPPVKVEAPVPQPEAIVQPVQAPVPIQQVIQEKQASLQPPEAGTPPPRVPETDEVPGRPDVVQNRLTERGKAGEQNLSDEVMEGIQGEHAVRSTDKLDEASKADIGQLDDNAAIEEAYNRLNVEQGKIDDQVVAFTNQAIERAQGAGRMEDAINLHDMLSEHLVKQGQTIQAASLLYRLSPQGMFYKARRDLIKSGTEMTPELETKLKQQADAITKAGKAGTEDSLRRQAETIVDSQNRRMPPEQRRKMIDDLVANPTEDMRAIARQVGKKAQDEAKVVLGKTVADNAQKGIVSKLISIWKAGLLSGQKTFQGGILSNATFAGIKKISDVPAAIVDKGISLATGKRTKVVTARGAASGAVEGTKKGIKTFRTGIDERNVQNGGKFEQHGELNFKNPVINTVFGKTTNAVFRTLSAADQPFYFAAAKNNLYDQALAAAKTKGLKGSERKKFVTNLVANPTNEMAEIAKTAAEKSVLGYDTIGSKAIQGIHSSIERLPDSDFSKVAKTTAHTVVDVLAPFVKVPTAFIARTIDFTPAGILKTAIGQISRKKFDQRALSEAIGQGTTGTGIIALGIALAQNGQLSGDYPKGDPKEAARWKAEGITPNSVKLGDKWVSLNYLGPVGLLFNAGKQMEDGDAESAASKVAAAAGGLGQGLMGQSFLQGFSGFSDAIKDPERNAKSFVNSQASSVVPAWLNDAANLTDEYQRQADTVPEAMKNRVPGLRQDNKVKQDVYGNKLKQAAGQANTINALKPSENMTDKSPAVAEVARLHDVDPDNKDLQITPTTVEKKLTVEGQTVKLDNDQRYELQEKVGQATQERWNQLIETDEYKALSDEDKAKALVGLRQASQELETRDFVESKGLASYEKRLSGNARRLKEDGSLARFARSADDEDTVNYADKYADAKDEYEAESAKWTPVKRAKKQREMRQLAVQKDFDADTVSLYGMGKADVYALVNGDPDGKRMAEKIIEYGDKLEKAGLGDNKFRNSKGGVSIRPKEKGAGGGRGVSDFSLYSGNANRLKFDKSLRSLVNSAHLA